MSKKEATDYQKIKFLLQKLGERPTLTRNTIETNKIKYTFNDDFEIIDILKK